MRLLVTNDDSLESAFLHELVAALRHAGHQVWVAAPAHEQSWIGTAKSRHRPVTSVAVDRGLGCPTWEIDGTPSDCVNIALAHLVHNERIEAVVSGINIGLNASLPYLLASGTVAGAWEGALHGLPALACSHDLRAEDFARMKVAGAQPTPELQVTLRHSAAHAAKLTALLLRASDNPPFTVHNLNFPAVCRVDTAVRRTLPERLVLPKLFGPADGQGRHHFAFRLTSDIPPTEPLTDRACLAAGMISHTVLDYSRLGVPAA